MRTQRRLTEAYQNARVISFDDESRFVFISDCHRGDGSLSDEFMRNENSYLHALNYYYRNGFVYVEVGDGDELWEHPHFKHIRGAHHDTFRAIERFFDDGRYVLIWGNHNNFLRDASYVEKNLHVHHNEYTGEVYRFMPGIEPIESVVFQHDPSGQEIVVLHGHQGDFANDQFWWPTMFALRHFWRYVHALGARNPASPAKNALKRHKIERHYTKWIKAHKKAPICGHTHRFKYPRDGEVPYFNAGCCVYPTMLTAIELSRGELRLVLWHVVSDADGHLKVERRVIGGPEPVGRFAMG
ncbi:MAG TPA: serine/threonine protein phosphatase [Coriobacteriia bacterium]|jgi:predicted phosphodiesterase|nr:MAG: Uncharacterized protein XD74_0701 [Actinobacteria bacterium 66_15]HAL29976.1 serine/threonine protein phosphatase [Coriobacteriia bacterium]